MLTSLLKHRMNILYLADPNSIHDQKWISYFSADNLDHVYILPRIIHRSYQATELQRSGVNLLRPIPDFSILRFYRTLYTALKIQLIIRKYEIDIINIHYAEPNALWCLFRWFFKVPMIITTLGTDVLVTIPEAFSKKTLINYLVAPAYRRAFKEADWITGTSGKQLTSVFEFSGRNSKISIVRTGVNINRLLADTSNYFPLDLEVPYILFPRYIYPIYNHEFCLEAIGLLPNVIKQKYTMVFVGKDSGDEQYQKQLEELMIKMKDVKFKFLPKLTQEGIFELYKRASLVVMTPISDGSPVSAMEAMICKVPLILPPLKYDQEIFGNTTYSFKNWDPLELGLLMRNILTDRNFANAYVEQAYIAVLEKGNFFKEMEKVRKLYQSLIDRNS